MQVKGIDEIICVDDGSSDNTAELIQQDYPQVRLLRSEINQGKACAVLQGLEHTDCELILLVDADLQRIVVEEFSQALLALKTHPEIDMLVLRKVNKDPFTRMIRGDLPISDERLLRRVDLLDVLDQNEVRGFQLEVAINQYMLEGDKTVRWFPISSVGVISVRKIHFLRGLWKEIHMFSTIFAYIGLIKFFQQVLFLGREKI